MKLRITVEGVAYEVEVEVLDTGASAVPPSSASVAPPSAAGAAPPPAPTPVPTPSGGGAPVCKSPLAGNVLAVHVREGDRVEENQVVALLEAMKMETKVASPLAGTVKAVLVQAGDTVRSGQVLVEFE